MAGAVCGCLPKNVKAKGINPWICFLFCAALLYSPLSFGRIHDSHAQQSQTTTQSAEESQSPIIEYVRVKMGKSIFLEPPEEDEPGNYLRIRDTSGNDFELQDIVAAKIGDGSGIGITVSLSWIDSTDSIVELDLLINSPCQVKPWIFFRQTVTFSQRFYDGGNCFNSEDERIGRAGYRDHLDIVPFKSFVFDNAPTGDYEIFVVTGCYRRWWLSFFDGGRGKELCISSRAEYKFEVIYGDQRRIISGTYNGLRLAKEALPIENALSSIKFRFVNVNPRYCYSFRGTEVCTAPPF